MQTKHQRQLLVLVYLIVLGCMERNKIETQAEAALFDGLQIVLDSVWHSEQAPIRKRDSLMRLYGVDSEEAQVAQAEYKRNHVENERIVLAIFDRQGWPEKTTINEQGHLTLANVLQHASMEVREKYLPMMRQATAKGDLEPRLLARAEDRLATDRGELQRYGGKIKYYPESGTFDVWPIFEPEQVDQRRAAIGLEPMAEFLKNRRMPLPWDVTVQIQRSKRFLEERTAKQNEP